MRKFLLGLLIAITAFCFTTTAYAEAQDMWAAVYKDTGVIGADGRKVLTRVTSGITFKVLAVNADTAETLTVFDDDTATSLTNPVTTANFESATVCDDKVAFRVDPTDSSTDRYVDLIVTDTSGMYTTFVENFDKYQHTIVIDERPSVPHVGTIWFSASSTVETDTGIDFLPDTLITDTRTETVTVDAGETLDVGLLSTETSGDADGLIDGRSVATAGFTADTGVITDGTTSDYIPDSTYGALLYTIVAGSDAAATHGGRSYLGHVVTGSNAVSLTYTGSAGSDTAAGYIYVEHMRLR